VVQQGFIIGMSLSLPLFVGLSWRGSCRLLHSRNEGENRVELKVGSRVGSDGRLLSYRLAQQSWSVVS
jgi:hypothetical protein